MASLTADTLKVLEPILEGVREKRDIYLSIFISFEGVNINVYPYNEESED